jgi:hypothetical protein
MENMVLVATSMTLKHKKKGSDMIGIKSLALAIATSGILAGSAMAGADHGHTKTASVTEPAHGMAPSAGQSMKGGNRMQMMHSQMMGGGAMGMMGGAGDGATTPEDMRARLQAALSDYDADGNGSLSIDEYETYHSALIRENMVDRFQHLDADGDGAITGQEIIAPADQMARMKVTHQRMHGEGSDAAIETLPGDSLTQD